MNNDEYKRQFRKIVSNVVLLTFPSIVCEWEREPSYSNDEVLKILSDIILILAYAENHPQMIFSIRAMQKDEFSCQNDLSVINRRVINKMIMSAVESACPKLEEIWGKNPDESNREFSDKICEMADVLRYAYRHPRFLQSLKNVDLK